MGVRAESRQRTVAAVMQLGRAQLAEVGAPGLSLRAIARDLGLVSSAVYRYFPSRDALLTALIIEAFDELGAAAEAAEGKVSRGDVAGRIKAVARAMRTWALSNPNEYALIFGSPVPGYVAPQDTIAPASRIPVLLIEILRALPESAEPAVTLRPAARRAVAPLQQGLASDVDAGLLGLGYSLWEFLVGAISTEVFGHQVNVIDPEPSTRAVFFDEQVRAVSALVLGTGARGRAVRRA